MNDTDFSVSNCDTCALAKSKQQNHPKVAFTEVTQPLELVYTDLSGPISPSSGAGNSYVAKFTDHHTRLKSVYFLSKKNEVIDALMNYQVHPRRGDSIGASTSASSLGPRGRVHRTGISRVLPTDRSLAGICGNEYTTTERGFRTWVGVSVECDQMFFGRGWCPEISHGSLPSKLCPIYPSGRQNAFLNVARWNTSITWAPSNLRCASVRASRAIRQGAHYKGMGRTYGRLREGFKNIPHLGIRNQDRRVSKCNVHRDSSCEGQHT